MAATTNTASQQQPAIKSWLWTQLGLNPLPLQHWKWLYLIENGPFWRKSADWSLRIRACVTNICTSLVRVPVEQPNAAAAVGPAVSRARWQTDRQTDNQAPIQQHLTDDLPPRRGPPVRLYVSYLWLLGTPLFKSNHKKNKKKHFNCKHYWVNTRSFVWISTWIIVDSIFTWLREEAADCWVISEDDVSQLWAESV